MQHCGQKIVPMAVANRLRAPVRSKGLRTCKHRIQGVVKKDFRQMTPSSPAILNSPRQKKRQKKGEG